MLAITLGKLMTAVNEVFDRNRRDLLHVGFYVLSFVAIMIMWWAQWSMVKNENWNFTVFPSVENAARCLSTQALVAILNAVLLLTETLVK